MKVNIQEDELYPYYFLQERLSGAWAFDVDDATVARWKNAEEEFFKCQDEMGAPVRAKCKEKLP